MTQKKTLAVDLDGSLIFTDLFFESFVRAIKLNPLIIFCLPFWLAKGIGYLKAALAVRASIDFARLPYNQDLIQALKDARADYGQLVLCTGSHRLYAEKINDFLGVFDAVHASTEAVNLTGRNKAHFLLEKYGDHQFSYVGNELKDQHIWRHAQTSWVVSEDARVIESAERCGQVEHVFKGRPRPGLKIYLKAMRVHQWMKNILVFLPLITAHVLAEPRYFMIGLLAFVCFGLVASGTYIINDLFDLDADRAHPKKCNRPFASGAISIQVGLLLSAVLLVSAFVAASFLSLYFIAVLVAYIITTLAYSFKLKHLQTIDVIVLASLYTVRVLAGSAAAHVWPSFWLLSFSMFLFFSLAIVKRVSELLNTQDRGLEKIKGRGYFVSDLSVLQSIGSASGMLAVLVLALYINSEAVLTLYKHPEWLWLLCPILAYWIMRIWMLTARQQMDEDPITFAIRDKNSWAVGIIGASVILLGTLI